MSEVFELYDASGQLRRPNTWAPPVGFVSSFPPFAGDSEKPLWDDADIRKVISDSNRRRCEEIFDPDHWMTNQLHFSSCTGFGTAGSFSKARFLRGINDLLVLSGPYIYGLINGGRDAGSLTEDGLKVIRDYGAPPLSLVGPTMIYPHLQPKSARQEAARHVGLEAYRADSKQAWRTGLAAGFLGVGVVHAGSQFTRMKSLSTGTSCAVQAGVDRGSGNHCISVIDFRLINGTDYFLIENSWGQGGWGSRGRAWVTWDTFSEPFLSHSFFLIPTSSES